MNYWILLQLSLPLIIANNCFACEKFSCHKELIITNSLIEEAWQSGSSSRESCFGSYLQLHAVQPPSFSSGVAGADGLSGYHWLLLKLRKPIVMTGFSLFIDGGTYIVWTRNNTNIGINCKDHCSSCAFIQKFFRRNDWQLIGSVNDGPGYQKFIKKSHYQLAKMIFIYKRTDRILNMQFNGLKLYYLDASVKVSQGQRFCIYCCTQPNLKIDLVKESSADGWQTVPNQMYGTLEVTNSIRAELAGVYKCRVDAFLSDSHYQLRAEGNNIVEKIRDQNGGDEVAVSARRAWNFTIEAASSAKFWIMALVVAVVVIVAIKIIQTLKYTQSFNLTESDGKMSVVQMDPADFENLYFIDN